jgi:hypothetical protein
VGATDFPVGVPAKHTRNFHHARFVGHHGGIGRGDRSHGALVHDNVVMGTRPDLCQMRNGKHLMMRRDATHERAHLPSHGATNTGVDFVEHQGGYLLQLRQHRAQRQHHTRQLTT